MAIDVIGWDIGGAHVKAARLSGDGFVAAVTQEACALWQGIAELEAVVPRALATLGPSAPCLHAITMTGELVDAFACRRDGVRAIVAALGRLLGLPNMTVYAGPQGFVAADRLAEPYLDTIASANWLASAAFVATQLPAALFVDMGSTTTDILAVRDGSVHYRGYTDFERLRQEELVYTGVVRTAVMAVAERAPFDGDMVLLAAEHFATMADVYRLSGRLHEHADQWPAADGGPKTAEGSARRLARLLGRDLDAGGLEPWRQVAAYVSECQLEKLHLACLRQLSRCLLEATAPLVGAGVGRFVLQRLAQRLDRPYVDIDDLISSRPVPAGALSAADLAPAVAVAKLAQRLNP